MLNRDDMKQDKYNDGIILGGVVHILTDKKPVDDNEVINNVCEVCSLRAECREHSITPYCAIFDAEENEYFTEAASVIFHRGSQTWTIDET